MSSRGARRRLSTDGTTPASSRPPFPVTDYRRGSELSKREQEQRRKTLRPHPARDAIVDTMRSYAKPISPTRLGEITGNTLGATAYHVRMLAAAGVVYLAKEGRVRGAVEHYYALVEETAPAINDPLVSLQRVCGVLTIPTNDGYPLPVDLDALAREQLQTVLDKIRPQVEKIVRAAAERQPKRPTVRKRARSTKRKPSRQP
jgi:DNA-binding transcriptional ArsR family regulator